MFKRTISYKDFDGNQVTEVLLFNLSNPELMALQASYPEGYAKHLTTALETGDKREVVKTLQDLILSAYGEKSSDGRRFIKSEQMKTDFEESAAYEALFTEMLMDKSGQKSIDFVNALFENVPKVDEAETK